MSLLLRRRALLSAKGKPLLPREYQQAEYLECSGTQYIDTGFYLKSEDDIEFKISSENFSTTGKDAGVFTTTNTSIDPLWHYSCNFGAGVGDRTFYTWKYYASAYSYITRIWAGADGQIITIKTMGRYWYVDNRPVESNGRNPWTSGKISPIGIHLFAGITNGAVKPHQSTPLRMHYFKVINDTETVAEFIPCYRKADGKTGMYDTVNNRFCQNNGIGEFILGSEITD